LYWLQSVVPLKSTKNTIEDELKDTVPVISTIFSSLTLIVTVVCLVLVAVLSVDIHKTKWMTLFGSSRLSFHLPLVLTFTVKSQDKKLKSRKTTCQPPKGLQYHEMDQIELLVTAADKCRKFTLRRRHSAP
jgi:short subunit fatty acids transporter